MAYAADSPMSSCPRADVCKDCRTALNRERYRQLMAGCTVNANIAGNRQADVAQADYYRRELSGIRARAESDMARKCIELQQLQNSGLLARAAEVRRIIRALEHEITTLERLGQGLNRWL